MAAFDGQIGQAAYAASKGGVAGMTLPLARDLARDGIRVMAIAPASSTRRSGRPARAGAHRSASRCRFRRAWDGRGVRRSPHIIDNEMLNGEVIRLDGAIRMAPR